MRSLAFGHRRSPSLTVDEHDFILYRCTPAVCQPDCETMLSQKCASLASGVHLTTPQLWCHIVPSTLVSTCLPFPQQVYTHSQLHKYTHTALHKQTTLPGLCRIHFYAGSTEGERQSADPLLSRCVPQRHPAHCLPHVALRPAL